MARPASLRELFTAFTVLALQGFGGVIAIAQRELCERRRWLTAKEFVELLGTAQVLPGPNVCNLSLMIGDRFFGWRGAAVALAGMMTAPLILMLLLAWLIALLPHDSTAHGLVRGALTGIAAVAAGQIVGTVLRLAAPLKQHPLSLSVSLALVAAAFGMMAWLRWPLVWVLLGLGGATCLLTYAVLRHRNA
ncbi:chromate transporter [Aquabacterium sp.]|uniref:chromate transporter n=1 Tax=Aquabacterium sp. TaxID=1872578 RepID=UPI0025BC8210|nr:chromate transporter [Aquabacterium sp.]